MTGTLALVGGNEFRADCILMDRMLLTTLDEDARVAILPTAAYTENPGRASRNGVAHFTRLGARAQGVMIVDRQSANDPALAGPLSDFNVIYLTGGSPLHLLYSLRDSTALVSIKDVLSRGGIVAGSSAGAMAMGEKCWGFGDGWLDGWGLAPGVAVIPHHASMAARWGADRMCRNLPEDVVLLGIDEATVAYGDGTGAWQVVGPGKVTVYAGKGVSPAAYSDGQSFKTSD